jgi:thiol:disulfide interchange protein DsbG
VDKSDEESGMRSLASVYASIFRGTSVRTALLTVGAAICVASVAGAAHAGGANSGASAKPPASDKGFENKRIESAPLPPPISAMLAQGRGVTVLDSFKVDGTDLTAWIVKSGGEKRIFYVPASGSIAILGLAFDSSLNNITTEHALRYSSREPEPANTKLAGMRGLESDQLTQMAYAQMAVADSSHVEGTGRDIYVIYDPGCSSCHRFWNQSRQFLSQLRVHWIPIAKVTQASPQLAESILGAADPATAFAAAANRRLAPAPTVSERTASILKKNLQILEAAGKKNVPYVVFASGGRAYGYVGAPPVETLKAIAGVR